MVAEGLKSHADLIDDMAKVVDFQSLGVRDQASPKLGAIRRELARAGNRVSEQTDCGGYRGGSEAAVSPELGLMAWTNANVPVTLQFTGG